MDNNSINFHNIADSTENDHKSKKVKEAMLLLKQKMCKVDVFLKQYTENVKEVDNLKSSLDVAKKEVKRMISDYSSDKDEIRELKRKIVEYEQNNEKLINKISEYDINIAADKQSIQQLTCKIKELGEEQSAKIMEYNLEKSFFEDKIKDLEHELKTLRKNDIQTVTCKKKEKKIISTDVNMAKPGIKSTSDKGINVSLCDIESGVKCEVQDKNIMTDEFYHTKNDPYPLFCAKCEAHLPPDLTPEKIFKTMTTYPQLIEEDLSPPPKKIYSPPCSLPSTATFANRNEDSASKISSIPHLHPYSPCSDSVAGNLKSGRSSAMTQICENVELRNTNISHIPLVANLSNNLSSMPTLSQNRNCTMQHFCSDDLLIKSSSKEMNRKIRSLKRKIKKKFLKLKQKIDTNSRCHCIMNHKDDISLNSNLISVICKGVAEYFNEKREACSGNERDIDSEKCICCTRQIELKGRQQSNKCNACESMFPKFENFDENDRVRDTCYNKTENATKITDILQSKHTSKHLSSSVHNSYFNVNTSSTSLNDIDETDKEEFFHKEDTLHSVEVAPVENNLTMSHLSVDKLYASNDRVRDTCYNKTENATKITDILQSKHTSKHLSSSLHNSYFNVNTSLNDIDETDKEEFFHKENILHSVEVAPVENNLTMSHLSVDKLYASKDILNKDNVEANDVNNQTIETISLCNNENSSDLAHSKIVVDNVEKHNVKRNSQTVQKDKIGDRLLKNLRNLKRKKQPISRINKQENIESYSNYNSEHIELAKKPRIENEEINNCPLNQIRNLKRNLNIQIESINNQEDGKLCSNHYEPTKKLRIAHIPKKPVQLSINGNDSTHCTIRNIATLATLTIRQKGNENQQLNTHKDNSLIENKKNPTRNQKCDEKNVKFIETNSIDGRPVNEEDLDLTNTENSLQNNDITPSAINIEYVSEHNENQQLNTHKDNSLIESKKNPTRNQKCDEKNIKFIETNSIDGRPVNEEDLDLTNAENSLQNNDITPSAINIEYVSELAKCEMCVNNKTIKMQAIKTQNKNPLVRQRNKQMELIFVPHNVEESQTPISRLYEYINNKKYIRKYKSSRKEIEYACKITDKFVKKQLQRLINSDWKGSMYDSIYDDVKVKLESTCGPRIIAKGIVEFIIEEVDHTEALDKSFTPPAPLMTKFEQKLVVLLFDLEISKPTLIYFVQAAIEYHLFRLTSNVKNPIDSLTRIYVILSRIQKDREKIRMMCCNALYCMKEKSIAVLNVILTCWSEVLPNAKTNTEILSKCIAFLINSLQINTNKNNYQRISKKLQHLKSLVSACYNYTKESTSDIVKELLTALKAKRIEGLDTAIILIAKREEASWTYENIIKSIQLMILDHEHPCIYSAFSLLGRLLRSFPLQDKDQIVHKISIQLCDLIQSGQGSHDQQEGIISALLSLSRHEFDVISWPIIKWTPNKSLRPIVDTQLQAFLHTRTLNFWKQYLRKKNIKLVRSKAHDID